MNANERLEKIKQVHLERIKQNELYTATFIHVDWLIEQAEKAIKYKNALENISDILEGQNVTPLVERLAYVLADSGIYDKD